MIEASVGTCPSFSLPSSAFLSLPFLSRPILFLFPFSRLLFPFLFPFGFPFRFACLVTSPTAYQSTTYPQGGCYEIGVTCWLPTNGSQQAATLQFIDLPRIPSKGAMRGKAQTSRLPTYGSLEPAGCQPTVFSSAEYPQRRRHCLNFRLSCRFLPT